MRYFVMLFVWGLSLVFAAVNINTADKKTLMSVKGIGDKTAEAIISYRNVHKFNSIQELIKVKGIGQKKLDKIKSEVEL